MKILSSLAFAVLFSTLAIGARGAVEKCALNTGITAREAQIHVIMDDPGGPGPLPDRKCTDFPAIILNS